MDADIAVDPGASGARPASGWRCRKNASRVDGLKASTL
jgi:hypothetical protein